MEDQQNNSSSERISLQANVQQSQVSYSANKSVSPTYIKSLVAHGSSKSDVAAIVAAVVAVATSALVDPNTVDSLSSAHQRRHLELNPRPATQVG